MTTTDDSDQDPYSELHRSGWDTPSSPAEQDPRPDTTPSDDSWVRPGPPRKRSRVRLWLKRSALVLVSILLLVETLAVALRFADPSRTMFMATDDAPGNIVQQNVSIDHISRSMISAAIVHEDGELGTRSAPFDYAEFRDRIVARLHGQKDPAGSSIPQQVTKNIFFNRSQNVIKKGVEAVFAIPFGYTISDKRMIEIYLNIAQFGPNLYGVCAATWYYFGVPPWDMSAVQAQQLAGTLPLGEDVRRAPGGGIDLSDDAFWLVPVSVNRASGWFIPQIESEMGGWEGVVGTIGINEPASAFSDTLNEPDACSTMPDSVRERLTTEGAEPK